MRRTVGALVAGLNATLAVMAMRTSQAPIPTPTKTLLGTIFCIGIIAGTAIASRDD